MQPNNTPTPPPPPAAASDAGAAAQFADLRFKAQLIPTLCADRWLVGTADDGCDVVVDNLDNEVCYTTNSLNAEEYGQYIAAANPAVVLRLLAALDTATARAETAEAQLRAARQELGEAWAEIKSQDYELAQNAYGEGLRLENRLVEIEQYHYMKRVELGLLPTPPAAGVTGGGTV